MGVLICTSLFDLFQRAHQICIIHFLQTLLSFSIEVASPISTCQSTKYDLWETVMLLLRHCLVSCYRQSADKQNNQKEIVEEQKCHLWELWLGWIWSCCHLLCTPSPRCILAYDCSGGALSAVPSAGYGAGTGPIWLNNVDCHGNETRLSDCSSNG